MLIVYIGPKMHALKAQARVKSEPEIHLTFDGSSTDCINGMSLSNYSLMWHINENSLFLQLPDTFEI